jgi:hypothetical protein
MSVFALVAGEQVAELAPEEFPIHPALVWVDVSSVSPPPNVGWTATETAGVWTFTAPAGPAPPTLAEQAVAAIDAGLAVTSTSTPALNGTYGVDPTAQGRIASVSTYILVNGRFPGGVTAYPWLDVTGAAHVFPTTAAFQAFATALADYVAALDMIAATGSGSLPVAAVTIA